jgi:hypothetical protein
MMADNGVKPHTTVTVTTQSGLAPQDTQPMEIRLNIGYFKSFQGIIKIVQLVLGIICMACAAPAQTISTPDYFGLGHNHFFLFIVVTTFIITLIWTFFYLLQVKDTIKVKLPFTFMWMEVIFTLLATVFYIVAWIVLLSGFGWCTTSHITRHSTICDARVAAGVFGIFNSIAYGLGTYLTYQEYNNTPPELQ